MILTLGDGFKVSSNQEGCVSSLQCNRKALKKVFYFNRRSLSPASSFLSGHLFEDISCNRVPTTEGFDDERLEEDALSATVFKMRPVFGRFPHFDGGGGSFGGS